MEEFPPVLKRAQSGSGGGSALAIGRRGWRVLALCLLGLLAPAAASPAERKKPPQSAAVIAGTVFHHPGRSFPGAQITVTPKPSDTKSGKGMKGLKAVSDTRGEFAVRVPAGAMRYNIRVEAKGFHPEEKEVATTWDERVDVFFRLRPSEDEAGESK